MKKIVLSLLLPMAMLLNTVMFLPKNAVYAEDEDVTNAESENETDTESKNTTVGMSIKLTPVSKVLQISSNSVYEDSFTVINDGNSDIEIETYAAPYSYFYSDEEGKYKLGFNNENNFTQISRWITFRNIYGAYVKKAEFTIEPGESLEIYYKITTPSDIPGGGQYAVIFAHTLTGSISASGIKTEASPGLIVYGRSTEGETIVSAEISDPKIEQTTTENGAEKVFRASAKVKNTGNVDFNAIGVLKASPIIGFSSYETDPTQGRISIIPNSELTVSDEWDTVPSFGIYKVSWTVSVGDDTKTIEKIVFLFSPMAIIICIILLTIIVVGIIIMVRKRKERRSRLTV